MNLVHMAEQVKYQVTLQQAQLGERYKCRLVQET